MLLQETTTLGMLRQVLETSTPMHKIEIILLKKILNMVYTKKIYIFQAKILAQ